MAWKQVKVKIGKVVIDGMAKKDYVEIPNTVDIGETINIDGKDLKVLSSVVILSGDMIKITFDAEASSKMEKSKDGGEANKQS